ncbi:MAG: HAD-IA family hydrolase [Gammaproteobacteria bacterium]|jgi:phosphoglycolate phosphatase
MIDAARTYAATAVAREIRLIVFDWDGTLMDSEQQIVSCLRAAVCDLSLEPMADETLRNVIGLGLREAIDTLVPGRDHAFQQAFVEQYRRHWFNSRESQLFAGVSQMLHTCRQHRFLLGIATGKSRRGLDRVLAENALSDCFDATRCADEAPSKPHPQMLYDIMARLGVPAEQVLMVGDTEYDMEMATNAGVAKVAVSSGVHSAARLQRHDPLVCLPQVAAIPAWLSEAGIVSG